MRSFVLVCLLLALALLSACQAGRSEVQEGKAALKEQRLDDAEAAFRRAIDADSKNIDAHMGLGESLLLKKDYLAAIDSFGDALGTTEHERTRSEVLKRIEYAQACAAGTCPEQAKSTAKKTGASWWEQFLPILILLGGVGLVLWRLPKVEIAHSAAFRRRRFFNWFPLGLTYAFLYMGRYNLTVAKNAFAEMKLMTNDDFGLIFGIGAITYGVAFIINGPLCDKLGGRMAMLIGTIGVVVMNVLMGLMVVVGYTDNLVLVYSILFAGNMYFQSFGAVSIVKVNASWFHVRERGVLGGIFGILISLGVYFAYDWNEIIIRNSSVEYAFFVPAAIIGLFILALIFVIRDEPAQAGFENFDVGDASSGEQGPALTVPQVFKKMLTNPIILTIAVIEFSSGFLRNSMMQWGKIYPKQTGAMQEFVFSNWGLSLCMAGILAGMFAGIISDYLFRSRRGPVSAILYAGMLVGTGVMFLVLGSPLFAWTLIFMSLCVIGVHGMLSGTASMDFGGKKNAGVAVGIIDACVYLGTGAQSFLLGGVLPDGYAAMDPDNWHNWPLVMMPFAILGLFFSLRIWNARPKGASAH